MLTLANIIQDAFGPLIKLFESILVFLHGALGGSWGVAIIALTVLVRAALVPLTLSQFRSMQSMQKLAPQIKGLQAKYKEDKQRLNEEMMKLYRENKVNPFASCLPLVLQLPVFVSLFYMLRTNLKLDICGPELLRHFGVAHASQVPSKTLQNISCGDPGVGAHHAAKFLFIPDITHQTSGAVLVVLLVLYVGSQLGSSVLMSASADPNQRRLMMVLPLLFVVFIFRFPGGLLVYWITTNLWTIGQQYLVRRRVGPPPARGTEDPPETPPAATEGGANGFRLGRRAEPALAGVGAGSGRATPPPPPRKKKKRSGRRR